MTPVIVTTGMAALRKSRAEAFADEARSVLRRAGLEKYSLLCAVQARLGTSSRSQAVTRARQLGLLEG